MKTILEEKRFDIVSEKNKEFILAFNNEITKLGYDFGGNIGSGFCWGEYMVIYSKTGVKNKQVAARIYIRQNSIVLRLFLNKIDKHREYIEKSKDFIKGVFMNDYGKCKHCRDDEEGGCKFRKSYSLEEELIEKCNGFTFEFWEPNMDKLPDYINLLEEFYRLRRKRAME
ncbi:hypothetical protein [Clostridium sp. Marseille-P299]|uniref:hypothetical protein n=1 Tax=Clostridium sp. Marseille-P299 TaxID=1805477 RepID=UPI000836776C|nr:hypothetical protein [Clostridium sp. Marseille-P299]